MNPRPRSVHRIADLVLVGLMAACQAGPPRIDPAALPASDLIERFRIGDPLIAGPGGLALVGETPGMAPAEVDALRLEDVMRSVERHFPLILAAMEEVEIASARSIQARGGFDTRLSLAGKSELLGDYQTDRVDTTLEQPTTLWGTTIVGGYRYGEGDFAVYDGEANTNSGGELRFGLSIPLLQGGRIDQRRVALWQARLGEERAQPLVLQKRLEATREGAEAYWKWLSWGRKREIARGLLTLAEDRQEQVSFSVEQGQLPRIAIVDNRRLIVERRLNLVRAERGLQEASILLSLWLRDDEGMPIVPAESRIPAGFPEPRDPERTIVPEGPQVALTRRPEIRALQLEIQTLELELELTRNSLLPVLDLALFAAQDLGSAVSTPDDKSDFEFEARARFLLPLQRRVPKGKRREIEAKIAKLSREAQLVKDMVVTDVADAASALARSWERVGLARENARLAEQLEEAEREQLRAGESDLLRVNLREQQTALAASSLVDVLFDYYRALADYRAVLGVANDEAVGAVERVTDGSP